jgi:large subunit ribosomal protein L4
MQRSFIGQDGTTQTLDLADTIFKVDFNGPLVHQIVCAYAAGERQGTHAQKTRGEVSGGGSKPWRQKGTGRARAGSIRSPIWRGGGATFAVKPRDYSQKINKKMYRGAMRSILSDLLATDRLIITDTLAISEPKTRQLMAKLSALDAKQALLVLNEIDMPLYLAARNIPHIKLCLSNNINPADLMRYKKTVITVSALKTLEESLV